MTLLDMHNSTNYLLITRLINQGQLIVLVGDNWRMKIKLVDMVLTTYILEQAKRFALLYSIVAGIEEPYIPSRVEELLPGITKSKKVLQHKLKRYDNNFLLLTKESLSSVISIINERIQETGLVTVDIEDIINQLPSMKISLLRCTTAEGLVLDNSGDFFLDFEIIDSSVLNTRIISSENAIEGLYDRFYMENSCCNIAMNYLFMSGELAGGLEGIYCKNSNFTLSLGYEGAILHYFHYLVTVLTCLKSQPLVPDYVRSTPHQIDVDKLGKALSDLTRNHSSISITVTPDLVPASVTFIQPTATQTTCTQGKMLNIFNSKLNNYFSCEYLKRDTSIYIPSFNFEFSKVSFFSPNIMVTLSSKRAVTDTPLCMSRKYIPYELVKPSDVFTGSGKPVEINHGEGPIKDEFDVIQFLTPTLSFVAGTSKAVIETMADFLSGLSLSYVCK